MHNKIIEFCNNTLFLPIHISQTERDCLMVFFFSFSGKINVGIATTNGDIKIQMTWSASLASAKNYHICFAFYNIPSMYILCSNLARKNFQNCTYTYLLTSSIWFIFFLFVVWLSNLMKKATATRKNRCKLIEYDFWPRAFAQGP